MSEKVHLLFEFRSPKFENKAVDFTRGKILVGRSPVCDFVIPDDRVSSFHALITFNNQGDLIIYDLESKNGIFFEDQRVQAYKLEAGVRFAIADISVRVSVQGNLALALSRLQEQTREIQLSDIMGKTPPPPPPMHAVAAKNNEAKIDENESLLYDDGWKRYHFYKQTELNDLYYPLENKKIALDSLIFDDDLPTDNIERGGKEEFGLEVIVSIGGVVIDLKNFPLQKQTIYLSGENLEAAENEVFFPTISKGEKKKFLELSREGIRLSMDTEGHYHSFSSDGKNITKSYLEKENQKQITMTQGNIYCLSYENLQIFLRIKSISKGLRFAPVFGRDKSLLWQIMVGVVVAVAAALTMTGIEIPVKKKVKREVAVIYKQTQNKVIVKKPDSGSPEQKKAPPKKQPKKKPKKKPQKRKPTPKKVAKKTVKKPKFSFMKKTNFKSFASSTNVASSKSVSKSNKKIDFSKSADVNYADESVDVADFSTGKESSKWNKKGLGGKGGYRAAAFSKKTVVLGAIDPEAIRKALAKYLSQFRACYQEELDLNSEDLEGIFDFQFRIGTNGRVTKSSLSAHGKNFSQNGINCMKRVLNKIQFPKPKGGGVVDIKQTFNFSSGGV